MIIKIVAVLASIPLAIVGFKKQKKALAVLAIVLIIAAYGLAEMSKMKKPSTASATIESSVNGHEIFTANCARCHGEDGKLGLMGSQDLSVSAMSLPEKTEVIKNGKGAMTPFAGMLSDEQIKAVAEYTESLKK
jgi:mono/diheme cytochrome c family protein